MLDETWVKDVLSPAHVGKLINTTIAILQLQI